MWARGSGRDTGEHAMTTRLFVTPGRASRSGVGLACYATEVTVDCWIGVAQEDTRRVVRLAGRLTVAQVPELLGACAGVSRLEIDLTELVSADLPGIESLQRLRSQGASLVGTPGYLQLKLDSPIDSPTVLWRAGTAER